MARWCGPTISASAATPIWPSRNADDSVQATGVLRATIDRIVMLGFEVRVELTSAADKTPFTAQITRGDAEALGLKEGDTVYVRATRVPELPGGTDDSSSRRSRRGRVADHRLSVRFRTRHAAFGVLNRTLGAFSVSPGRAQK